MEDIYDVNPEAIDIVSDIRSAAEKAFPNGYVDVHIHKNGISKGNIVVHFGIIGDKNHLPGGYRDNDPVNHKFLIFDEGNGKWEANKLTGDISTVPPEGSHLAMGGIKTPWRKVKGDKRRVIKAFETFFSRTKKMVKDNEAMIYKRDQYPDKYFR